LELADGITAADKVMALVRLHSCPLGVVVLDGSRGLLWSTHADEVWSQIQDSVSAHLAVDGLPAVDSWTQLGAAMTSVPGCKGRRYAVLENPPRITAVVATRERPELLRKCLDALLAVEYPDYEIVVVDNAPETTRTADLVASTYRWSVRYVREERKGLANAHNRALEVATGSIVAFVDDDVIVDRHWLAAIAEGFAAAPDVGCVTGLILPAELATPAQLLLEQHGGFDKGYDLTVFDTGVNRPDDPLFPFTAGRLGSGANMAFDAVILRALGGFDTAIGIGTFARGGDDLAAFFRVVFDHQLVYQPAAVVWHRHHRDMSAVQNQAYGYGVGLGAYLTSVLVGNPRTWAALLWRLPRGLRYAFSARSARNLGRYDGLPAELSRLERRGLMLGPVAYAVSRARTRRRAATPEAVRSKA
jgi:GT2 family glycosyltransferase